MVIFRQQEAKTYCQIAANNFLVNKTGKPFFYIPLITRYLSVKFMVTKKCYYVITNGNNKVNIIPSNTFLPLINHWVNS